MSALNIFVGTNRAHVFTDGGLFDHQNVGLVGIGCKVIPLPNHNAIITATGYSWVARLIATGLEQAPSGSERDESPVAYIVYGYSRNGWPAYHCVRSTKNISPPLTCDFDFDSPWSSGLELMRKQRNMKWGLAEDQREGHHLVAGFCHHTIVARDKITMRVLERWDDQIGKPIDP